MDQNRDRWDSRSAFVLAAMGSAVGLGNVIRFPAVCYANGGGAFFIPYLVALFTAGIPLLILEFGVGQMMQGSAPQSLKKINRHTEWVGWFALLVATVITVYYATLMGYALQFLWYCLKGVGSDLPWAGDAGGFFVNTIRNDFGNANELWAYHWPVVVGLALTYLAVYFIICKGVHRVGKVVKWTVPLPVLVLVILIIRGVTLPGAGEGIKYYLTPDLNKLSEPATWLAAYGQIFFSLTIGFGVMIAYASYRPRESDVTNNAFITALGNCATSFIAGFAVFSVVGFLEGRGDEVSSSGLSLAFVTYPTAVAQMGPVAGPLIGILFFLMLFALGIDSIFSLVEGVVAALRDRFPALNQERLTAGFCVLGFAVSTVFFANRAGIMWVDCFDHWANDYGLAIVGLLECLIIGYFYKTEDLRKFINRVSEIRLWGWWELCIRLITPVVLIFLLASTLLGDIERGRIYGMSEDGSGAFDTYAAIPPLVFLGLFVVAFALAGMRSYLLLIAGGVVAFGVFHWVLDDFASALFAAIASSILIGGLAMCLQVARRGEIPPDEDDGLDSVAAGES